jgi:hypothetical protein
MEPRNHRLRHYRKTSFEFSENDSQSGNGHVLENMTPFNVHVQDKITDNHAMRAAERLKRKSWYGGTVLGMHQWSCVMRSIHHPCP